MMFASGVLRLQASPDTDRLIPTAGNQKWLRPLSELATTRLEPLPEPPRDPPRELVFTLGSAAAARTAIVRERIAAGDERRAPRRSGSRASAFALTATGL